MTPRNLSVQEREVIRQDLIELQSRFDLSYRQLQRYARRELGLDLSRSGIFYFLN